MSIVDFINIPSHLLREDAEVRAAQVAAEYLGELRDRLISDVERVHKEASPEEFVAFALLDPWGEYE